MSIYNEIERAKEDRKAAERNRIRNELDSASQKVEDASKYLYCCIQDQIVYEATNQRTTKMKVGILKTGLYYVGTTGQIAIRFDGGCSFRSKNVEDNYSVLTGNSMFIVDVLLRLMNRAKEEGVSLHISVGGPIKYLYSVKWEEMDELRIRKIVQNLTKEKVHGAEQNHWVIIYGRVVAK